MNNLNSILLEGNLTRNPEGRNTPKGTPVCTFSVASNRWFKAGNEKQQEVSYFDVEAWSGLAERCSAELEKGRGVRVVGRLKQDRWLDQEGKSHSHVKIVAEHVEFKPVARNHGTSDEEVDDELEEGEIDEPVVQDHSSTRRRSSKEAQRVPV